MINTHCTNCNKLVSTKGSHLCAACYYHRKRKEERICITCSATYMSPKETISTLCLACREIKPLCSSCHKYPIYSKLLCESCYRFVDVSCKCCNKLFKSTIKNRLRLCPDCKVLKQLEKKLQKIKNIFIERLSKIKFCEKCKESYEVKSEHKKYNLCSSCVSTRSSLRWNRLNPTKARELYKQARLKNLEKDPAYDRAQYNRRLAKMNKEELEEYRSSRRKYRKAHQKERTARDTIRKRARAEQTPRWVDSNTIKRFYISCPPGQEVDHIIPIRGRDAVGLHCIENLQYLPRDLNTKKSNRLLSCYLEHADGPYCVLNLKQYL